MEDDDDLPGTESAEELAVALKLGMAIDKEVSNPTSPLSRLLNEAQRAAVAALGLLVDVDLYSQDGIEQARRLQNDARRHRELASWVKDHIAVAQDALDQMKADRAATAAEDEQEESEES